MSLKRLGHSGIDLKRWLTGFNHVREGIEKSVNIIRNHPFFLKIYLSTD